MIVDVVDKSKIFDECVAIGGCSPKNISNWILGDISKFMNETGKSILETPLTANRLVALVKVIEKGTISNSAGKTVFEAIISDDKEVEQIISEKGLSQISDTSFLDDIAMKVISDNEKSVSDYKGGKTNALGFLVGQCMKASQGKANPRITSYNVCYTKLLRYQQRNYILDNRTLEWNEFVIRQRFKAYI